jgi:hypothetical protein
MRTMDINWLIGILNNEYGHNIQQIPRLKHYEHITHAIDTIPTECNVNYISEKYTYEIFENYDVHIIQSTTGTGKTTAVARNVRRYLKQNKNTKFMTITDKRSLSTQHMVSFNDIGMVNYLDTSSTLTNTNVFTVCINSLYDKLKGMTPEGMKNMIVYIDEIATLLEFPHNQTLDRNMKAVYRTLHKLVNNCKKIILSDNVINDLVFKLLRNRTDKAKANKLTPKGRKLS